MISNDWLPSPMRIAIAVIGIVILLVGLTYALGSRLPVGHSATRVLHLNAPQQEVWAVLTDFGAQATWRTDIKGVRKQEGAARETWIEEGGNGSMPLETTTMEPPRYLVRTIADSTLPFGGKWIYELAPEGTGTRLTITEDGEVYQPIFRFISHYFINPAGTIETVMKALAARFKESPRIDAA